MTTPSTRSPFDTACEAKPDPVEVRLTLAQAHRVATILSLVQDFFTHHSSPAVRSALSRFAQALGWEGPRAAVGLTDQVYFAAAPLRHVINAAHLRPSTTAGNP